MLASSFALPLAAAAFAHPTAAPAQAPCASSDVAAVVCAVNQQRTANGLHAVRLNAQLSTLALANSTSMVSHQRFTHGDFGTRIGHSAWARHHHAWAAGETLAWGTGALAAPDAVVTEWMHSPEHRRIVLDAHYRVVGVGIAPGVPVGGVDGQDGRTYTADFGS